MSNVLCAHIIKAQNVHTKALTLWLFCSRPHITCAQFDVCTVPKTRCRIGESAKITQTHTHDTQPNKQIKSIFRTTNVAFTATAVIVGASKQNASKTIFPLLSSTFFLFILMIVIVIVIVIIAIFSLRFSLSSSSSPPCVVVIN